MPAAEPHRGRRGRRFATAVVLAAVVGVACAAGTIVAARSAIDTVQRSDDVVAVLSPASDTVENYLLVGSDSRAGSDPNSPDYGGIGDESDVSGHRSDTIMVLRRDRATGAAALLSIPRDLWVPIAGGGKSRINSAFNDGPSTLVQTVQQALGIPVHHYVEVDFSGFKELVDALGGVQVCFMFPTRDTNTGLDQDPGCHVLGGVQALAYARSRHYQEYRDGEWHEDGTADIGRTKRQRAFVDVALRTALDRVTANPFHAGDVLRAGAAAVTVDGELDLIEAAASLRGAVGDGVATYELPVRGATIGGNAVLQLANGAEQVLSWFRGEGPAPAPAS